MVEEGKLLGYIHALILFKVILELETEKQWRGKYYVYIFIDGFT